MQDPAAQSKTPYTNLWDSAIEPHAPHNFYAQNSSKDHGAVFVTHAHNYAQAQSKKRAYNTCTAQQ